MKLEKKIVHHAMRSRRTHAQARASKRVRLLIFKSNRTIYAQIIDDKEGKIICSTSGLKSKNTGIKVAEEVGTKIAELAKTKKIKEIVLDRNGYKYHGQIKALADSARKAGLQF